MTLFSHKEKLFEDLIPGPWQLAYNSVPILAVLFSFPIEH